MRLVRWGRKMMSEVRRWEVKRTTYTTGKLGTMSSVIIICLWVIDCLLCSNKVSWFVSSYVAIFCNCCADNLFRTFLPHDSVEILFVRLSVASWIMSGSGGNSKVANSPTLHHLVTTKSCNVVECQVSKQGWNFTLAYIHRESRKKQLCHPNHGYIFVNSWSICKILSLLQRAINLQQKCPPFARTHAWRCSLHWSIAVSTISPGLCPCKWF